MVPLDERALRRLFDAERDGLYRFLLRFCRDAADADDLLQEAFLAVWRKRSDFEGRGSLAGYLRRTAYRLFLNHYEARRRRERLHQQVGRGVGDGGTLVESTDRCVEREDSGEFLRRQLADAVSRLSDEVRDAFVLYRFEGWSVRDIAEASGVPIKTVETRLRRGVALVAQRLRPYRSHLPVGP